MKLRLPHKFQAALLAALASVSFTTLSSGTLAVATGAALLAGQQAQAASQQSTTVAPTEKTSSNQYFTWTDLPTTLTSWELEFDLMVTNGNNNDFISTNDAAQSGWDLGTTGTTLRLAYQGKNAATPLITIDNAYTIGTADSNKVHVVYSFVRDTDGTNLLDSGTFYLTVGDGEKKQATVTENISETSFTSGKARFWSNSACERIYALTLTKLDDHVVEIINTTWAGTPGNNLWSSATAWEGGEGFKTGANALFGADAYNTVVVDKSAQASTVTIDGAAYTFEGSGSVTAQSLAFTGDGAGLTLDTNMTLSTQSDYAALAKVTVAEGAKLAVNGGGASTTINLAAGSAGTLELTSGSISYHSNLGGATLQLDAGTTFYFDNNNGDTTHAYNGDIALGGNATIQVYGTNYHPNGVTFNGDITGSGKTLTKMDGGQLTINGKVDLGTLNLNSASNVVINGSADNKNSIGNLTSVTGSTLTITNTNLGISGGQSFMSNLDIGAGSTVTVKQTDSMKYSGITNTITLREDGVLDFGSCRWTVGNGTTFVMAGGEIKGAGDSNGALDFHQNDATIRATADSTISAKLRLRGTTTKFDVNTGATLTLSGVVRDNGNLRKMGAGTLVLSGNAEFSGSTLLDAGTIKVAGTGTLAQGQFTSAAGTRFINEGTATIGKDGADSSLAATVANSGALTLKGNIAVQTSDLTVYKVAHEGTATYSGTGTYAGSGYLNESTTQYYLVETTGSGTLTNSANYTGVATTQVEGNSLLFTVTPTGSDGPYYINSDLAYNGTEMGGATTIAIAAGKTLSVGGSDLATVMSKTSGVGNVTVSESGTITGGGSSSVYTTHATGTLTVAASKTLTLGTNKDNQYLDFSSFSNVVLENNAVINLKQHGMALNNLSVASGATAHLGKNDGNNDTLNENIDAVTLHGTTLVNGELQMGTNWKWQMSIDKLAGSGTLVARGANENPHLIINSFDGTFGTLKYTGNNTEIRVKGSGTITNLDNTGSSNTLTLDSGVTLEVINTAKVNSLSGSGTLVVDVTKAWSLGAATSWTGTLRLHGNKDGSIGNFVGTAGSIVELTDLNGWTSNWNSTISQNIKLTNGTTGYAWRNGAFGGSADQTTPQATFTGMWSGDGLFKVVGGTSNRTMNYKYTGDVSQWTGEFNKDGKQTTVLTFADKASEVNAVISKANGAATFTVEAATDAAFNRSVTADAFKLADGKTVTFNNAATFSGNMSATGGTVNLGEHGSLSLGGLTKTGAGELTLHGLSRIGSAINLQAGSLVFGAGTYDLSGLTSDYSEEYSGDNCGYLTITDTVQLVNKTAGSFSVDGATFKFTTQEGPATATTVNDQGKVEMKHEDKTTYILNNGTSMDLVYERAENDQLATVRVQGQGGTGTIELTDNAELQHLDVRDGSTAVIASENAKELALSDAASFGSNAYVEVQDGAYLKLSHGGTAAAVLTHAKGEGTITLAANASLGNGSATAATGTLTIADGKTLTLGGGDSTKVNISSFTQVVLDGGTISYNADESTINGLTVNSEKAGTLHLEDMGSKALVLGGDTVVDGTLTAKNHWNSLLTISHLTGDGTLVQTNGNAVQEMIFAINSLQGFTGAIELSHNMGGDTTSISTGSSDVQFRALTMNIGSHTMNFALDADATIDALTLTAGTANFTGAGTLGAGGVDGTAALNVERLAINVTEGAHTYTGTANIGKLTMDGEGTQTIGGTIAATDTWVLNGGTLVMTGTYNLDSMVASSRVAGYTGGAITGNGFESLNGIRMVSLEGGSVDASGATFSYGGVDGYTMRDDGVVTVASSGTVYDTFYILNNGDDKMETLINAREQAGEHAADFVNIVMAGGTSLDANEGGTLTALTVSGGTAGATTLVTDSSETSANLTITTVTVGVGENLTVQDKALTITSTVLNERAALVVGNGAAVTLSGVAMGTNSTFTVTGTGRVKLTDATTAKNLLLSATGDGTYELATNVTLGNGVSTTPTGTLVVDSGITLTLSGNKGQETYLDSFGKIQLEGGNIASNASMGTLHNVTVTADSAIKFNDFKDKSGGQHQSLTTFAGTTDIAPGTTLTVHTGYKSNLKYEGLSGAGTLKFTTNSGDYGGATVAIDSLQGFSGNITLAPGNNNPVNITAAIGDAPVSMGVITLANGGNITATGSNTLTVAGLDGTAGSLTVQNLTINVEGEGSHTYGGTLNVGGQLTKTGSGTQSLGTFTPAAPIVVSGGTLTFTGRVEIQQLNYTEGPRYTYTDASRTLLDQANGLRYEESKRAVYIPTGDGRVTLGENGAFTLGGQTVTVGEDGVYHSSAESADLTTLWVNTGMVNLADYASVAELTTAKLADAGTLNLGEAAAPGSIATLQYQEGATVLHLAGTGTVNAITGDANLNLAAEASVTLGYNPNIATGHTFTTAGEGALTVTTLTNTGGAISISSNLTVNGGEDGKGGTHNQQGLAITGGSGSVSILAGTTTVTGAVYTGGSSTGTTLNVGTGDADAVLVAGRIELGDHDGDTSAFTIGTRGTVVVTGDEDIRTGNNPQKNTSLQLSEWNQEVTTTVQGRLFAKDATAFMSRDKGSVIHVDGGVMAVKGIATTYADSEMAHTVTIDNDGKLVMGTFGLAAEHGAWDISVGTGEIGMYDTATTVGRDITVNGTLTLNTARYEWGGATPAETTLTQGVQEGTMTVSAALSGEGGIIKNGAGTLVLTGANTYSGGTVLNAGTLQATSLGSGDVTVNAGTLQTTALGADANVTVNAGTLDLTGAPAITAGGNLTLTDGATLVLAGANMLTMGGELSLSGAVTFVLDNILPSTQGDYVLATGTTASITEGADISVIWNTKPDYFEMGSVRVVDENKWVITLTSLGQDLIWNGGEAEWSTAGNHWHTDTVEEFPFGTGNKAIFATSEVAATANVNGDINASGVVVESGATVTIQAAQEAETASITAAEIEVSGNLTTSVNITATEIVGRGEAATWNIGADSTVTTDILTADAGATLTLSGEGKLTAGTITGEGTIVFDQGFPQPDVTTITVAEGKELVLSGEAEKTIAMENLKLDGTLVLDTAYSMTVSDTLNPGKTGLDLHIRNNGNLTVSLGSDQNALRMDADSTGDLHVGSGTISYLSELGGQTVHMAAGTTLLFGLPADETQKDDAEFTNNIVLDGNATVQVYGSSRHNSATISGDVTGADYTLTKADGDQTLTFSGKVNVGGLTTANNGNGTIVFNGGSGSLGNIETRGGVTIQFSNKEGEESSTYTFDTFNMGGNSADAARWLRVDENVTVTGTKETLNKDGVACTIMNGWGLDGGGLHVDGVLNVGVIAMDAPETNYFEGSGIINTKGMNLCNQGTTVMRGGVTINITSETGIFRRNTTTASSIQLADATLQAKVADWEFKDDGSNYTVNLTDAATGTTFRAEGGYSIKVSKALGGTGKMLVRGDGSGTVMLNGANSFSGGLDVTGATVEMGHNNALGNANNAISIGQGGVIDLKGHDDTTYAYTLAGGILQNTGGDTDTGHRQTRALTLTENSTVGGTGNFQVLNSSYNAATVTLDGHKLTKTGTNTVGFYTTTFDAGTLEVQGGKLDFANGGKGNDTFSGAMTIILNDATAVEDKASGTVNVNAGLSLNALESANMSLSTILASGTVLSASVEEGKTLTLTGNITGEGSVSKAAGDGTLVLAGTGNVITNQMTAAAGTLQFNGTFDVSALHEEGDVSYDGGTTATNAGGFAKLGDIQLVTGEGALAVSGATFTVGQDSSGSLQTEGDKKGYITFANANKSVFYIMPGDGVEGKDSFSVANNEALQTISMANGTTLVADGSFSTDLITLENGGHATLEIDKAATVTAGSSNKNLTLTGEGIYKLASGTLNLKGATLDSTSWTGIVMVNSYTPTSTVINFSAYANENSYVGLSGVSGVDNKWNSGEGNAETLNFYLVDKADGTVAWNWNDGAGSVANMCFAGKMAGSGTLQKTKGTVANNFVFTNDVSAWTGKYLLSEVNTASTVTFKDGAKDVAVSIENESNQALNVEFSNSNDVTMSGNVVKSGTGAMNVTVGANTKFTGSVQATDVTVGAGKSATFNGSLNVDGNATLNNGSAMSFGESSSIAIANTKVAASAHATVNGNTADVDFGNVNVGDNASLSVMELGNATSLNVSDVTIGAGATLGVYTGTTPDEIDEASLVIASGKTLTAAGEGATLIANLELATGSKLDVSATGNTGLQLGSALTINQGMTLEGYNSDVWSTWEDGTTYTLFTGVDSLDIGGGTQTAAIDYTQWVDAQQYFTNIEESNRYFLCYTGADSMSGGVGQYKFDGSNVGTVYIMVMPEPTTGTLSLLALCALAARRRRK